MKRSLQYACSGISVIVATFIFGCQHGRPCPTCATKAEVARGISASPTEPPLVVPTGAPASASSVVPAVHEAAVSARDAVEFVGGPLFAHDAHYGWLIGILDYAQEKQAWSIRFASAEQDERYEGVLPLVGTTDMSQFQRGQQVRIEGQIVPNPGNGSAAIYRVSAIVPIRLK